MTTRSQKRENIISRTKRSTDHAYTSLSLVTIPAISNTCPFNEPITSSANRKGTSARHALVHATTVRRPCVYLRRTARHVSHLHGACVHSAIECKISVAGCYAHAYAVSDAVCVLVTGSAGGQITTRCLACVIPASLSASQRNQRAKLQGQTSCARPSPQWYPSTPYTQTSQVSRPIAIRIYS